MGFTGMIAFSIDPNSRPDLGFFLLLLREPNVFLSLLIIVLCLALTISTVDTLINAISSLIVVDGKAMLNLTKKINYLNLSKYIIIFLSIVSFLVASRGFDILYLFLLADLFCCAFVFTVFYSFYNKNISERTAFFSIIIGLIGGFLISIPDFSKSLLVGIIIPKELLSHYNFSIVIIFIFCCGNFSSFFHN